MQKSRSSLVRAVIALLTSGACLASVAACGQKGPLTLAKPVPQRSAASTPAAPTSSPTP